MSPAVSSPQIVKTCPNGPADQEEISRSSLLKNPAVRGNPNIYPTPEVFGRLFVTKAKDQALLREVNRGWTEVKTGR